MCVAQRRLLICNEKKKICQAGQTVAKLSRTIYPAGKLQKQPDMIFRELSSGRAEQGAVRI